MIRYDRILLVQHNTHDCIDMIRRFGVYILLGCVYGLTYIVALLGSIVLRRKWKPNGRIMVTGAFFNPNWYLSHVTPLSRSGVKEVILATDEPQLPLEKVRFIYPPRWASRLLGRIGARTIWMFIAGLRYRPDLYMGYYLAPGACSSLLLGRLLGRPSCYQMTGGPIGIIGGGFGAVDSIEGALGGPSKLIEALAVRVIRQFELVVVRGNKAKEFLATKDIKDPVTIITGSVNGCKQLPRNDRDIHLIFVGRLSLIKQVDQFITIVNAIRRIMPNVRAAIVGDGPLMADMLTYTDELGLTENVEFLGQRADVEPLMARSMVFVLTSKSEGLSIAMIEAMAAGVVPVVANIGELSDFVADGVNGYLIEPNNLDEYVNRIIPLLQNKQMWNRISQKTIETARAHCDIEVVSEKWRQCLKDVVSKASGCRQEDVWN